MSLQRFRSSCLKFTDIQMTHSMTWSRHIVAHQVTVLICLSCLNHWPNSRTPTRLASSLTKLPGQKRCGHVLVWIFLVFCYHYLVMFCVNKMLISEISVPWVFIAYVLYLFLPARRYASAGYRDRNVSVRPSVCLSVCHAPVLCQNEES